MPTPLDAQGRYNPFGYINRRGGASRRDVELRREHDQLRELQRKLELQNAMEQFDQDILSGRVNTGPPQGGGGTIQQIDGTYKNISTEPQGMPRFDPSGLAAIQAEQAAKSAESVPPLQSAADAVVDTRPPTQFDPSQRLPMARPEDFTERVRPNLTQQAIGTGIPGLGGLLANPTLQREIAAWGGRRAKSPLQATEGLVGEVTAGFREGAGIPPTPAAPAPETIDTREVPIPEQAPEATELDPRIIQMFSRLAEQNQQGVPQNQNNEFDQFLTSPLARVISQRSPEQFKAVVGRQEQLRDQEFEARENAKDRAARLEVVIEQGAIQKGISKAEVLVQMVTSGILTEATVESYFRDARISRSPVGLSIMRELEEMGVLSPGSSGSASQGVGGTNFEVVPRQER